MLQSNTAFEDVDMITISSFSIKMITEATSRLALSPKANPEFRSSRFY